MKKDKAWLKEQIERLSYTPKGLDENSSIISKNWVLNFIDQLDESELTQDQVDNYLHERNFVAVDAMMVHQTGMQNKVVVEKPVIPQFVADYIEKWKYKRLIMHEWFMFDHDDEDEDKVSKWLYNNDDETNKRREFMLIDAIRYSYEVEKEPLYIIKFAPSIYGTPTYGSIGMENGKKILQSVYSTQKATIIPKRYTQKEIEEVGSEYMIFAEEVTE